MSDSICDLKQFGPYDNFREASKPILMGLHERLGFDLWMVTQTEDNDWKVLVAEDHGYGVTENTTLCWSDSFCYRMVQGMGPCIAPRAADVPAYTNAPIAQDMIIGAYIGIPLVRGNGTLYGTLCAVDPQPQPPSICEQMEFIMLNARLLSTLISLETGGEQITAQLKNEKRLSSIDELTGVYNRRGWQDQTRIESERCRRYTLSASIMVIDLDNFKGINDDRGHVEGDIVLRKTANCIVSGVRPFDIVSRIGGDEFALLIIDSNDDLVKMIVERIRNRLKEEQISASIGWANVTPDRSQDEAMREADESMYTEKRHHRKMQQAG